MNEFARKWVAALRSGQYRKTKEVLSKRGCYCVLGVACDLAVKEGICLKVEKIYDDEQGATITIYDGEDIGLPEKVRDALGLKDKFGHTKPGGRSLADLNDVDTLTFKELADIIEFSQDSLFEKEI